MTGKSQYNKSYYKNNKQRILKQQREYYYKKKSEDPIHILFIRLRSRAKEKGLRFNIEESDLKIPKRCPILNIPLYFTQGRQTANSPSVDRVNTKKGYVKDNVRIISNKANALKSDMSIEDIRRLYKYITEN